MSYYTIIRRFKLKNFLTLCSPNVYDGHDAIRDDAKQLRKSSKLV